MIELIKIKYSKNNYRSLEEAFTNIRDDNWYEITQGKDGKFIAVSATPVGFSTFCEAVRIALKK